MGLNLEATIGLNSKAFERGMERVSDRLKDGVKDFAIAAIGVYTVEQAIDKTIETARELTEQSKRMGVTVEQFQVMREAAKETGTEIENVATAMEKLNVARAQALGGGSEGHTMSAMFNGLGVNRQQLETMSAQDIIFGPLRQKILSVNPQEIAEPLREVLGRGGAQMIPMITEDMGELHKSMDSLGEIMDDKTAKQLSTLGEVAGRVEGVFTNVFGKTMISVAKWLLNTFTGDGTLGRAINGFAFWILKLTNEAELADYKSPNGAVFSARQRADAAGEILGYAHDNKKSIQQALDEYRNPSFLNQGASKLSFAIGSNAMSGNIFGDFPKNGKAKDFLIYLNDLIQAVNQADSAAENSAGKFDAGIKKAVYDWEHPSPDGPGSPNFKNTVRNPTSGGHRAPEDALIRVGNFLGSSRGVINSAQARLEQHAADTAKNTAKMSNTLTAISQKMGTSGGGFGGSSDSTDWASN